MAHNVNDLYSDLLMRLRECPEEQTRNGPVKSIRRPSIWSMRNPLERVLFNPQRKANPYFHIMETVWMLAGENKVDFLLPFNANMDMYANDGIVNGAYGHRWRNHFYRDQIIGVINELTRDIDSRQAVMVMYDPKIDYQVNWKDRPCNTHIYFRTVGGTLDMTVCNRSNDAVWGLAGANAVHMTYLQELIARTLRVPVGTYYVMTNNLHIYQQHWPLMHNPMGPDEYKRGDIIPLPMLLPKEDINDLLYECEQFVASDGDFPCQINWLRNTVSPMYQSYMCRKNGDYDTFDLDLIEADDWRLACKLWSDLHA